MIRFYPIIVFIQIFCIFHAFKNKAEQKWFWILLFLPFIGSLIYLYDQVFSRRKLEDLTEDVKGTFVNNYRIDKLEKELKFKDTISNRMSLAEEYTLAGNYESALELYESCNEGFQKENPHLQLKMLQNYYLMEDYATAVIYGERLEGKKEFINSEERVAYAWSQYYQKNIAGAESNFKAMDNNFTNYNQRLEYAYFLKEINKIEECKFKLEEMLDEIDAMDRYEQKLKRNITKEINAFYKVIRNS